MPVVVTSIRTSRAAPIEAGPILLFRGRQADRWRLSALFVLRGDLEPADLVVDGVRLPVPPRVVSRLPDRTVWRFDFAVPRGGTDERPAYGFADEETRWRFTVPAPETPLRLAYASCNGAEDEAAFTAKGVVRNAMWSDLLAEHRRRPFHLLLLGGDQVYADGVWDCHPDLNAWRQASTRKRASVPFGEPAVAAAVRFYADLYVGLWRQAEVAAMLASVPAVMMWDDHDIFDGYGSHPDADRETPVYRGLYAIARRHFALFQLGSTVDDLPDCVWGRAEAAFTQGFVLDRLGLLTLDLRSERTARQVLSEATWSHVPRWLDRFGRGGQLLVMSSLPVAFPDLAWVERLFNLIPGQAALEDDLRDQWGSHAHRGEHRRLLAQLFATARDRGVGVSVVSGEVHLAHTAVMRADGVSIPQYTASGIAHPPPTSAWAGALERIAGMTRELPGRVAVEFPLLPGETTRFVTARNWLSLEQGPDGTLQPRWHLEGRRPDFRLDARPNPEGATPA